jgi:hypothetical protein
MSIDFLATRLSENLMSFLSMMKTNISRLFLTPGVSALDPVSGGVHRGTFIPFCAVRAAGVNSY